MAPSSLEEATSSAIVGSARWRLFLYGTVASTNDLARGLLPWSAVRARAQTSGRGRFGRCFVSDPGGLWLSATMPAQGGSVQWSGFSLIEKPLAVPEVRLRWPNDLMSGRKKLAGLLIEQGSRESLTVGVGMNVLNTPWHHDPTLRDTSIRLADLLPRVPDLESLCVFVLDALGEAHQAMLKGGLSDAVREINTYWTAERPVEITLIAGETIGGRFIGLDPDANLRILLASGQERLVAHQYVAQLKEVG
jgi:BirA family biotin operon repressor/biotin-[acetyl-CoA-carboxylase] ligase